METLVDLLRERAAGDGDRLAFAFLDEGEGPGDLRNQRGAGPEGMAAERGRDGVLTKPVGVPPLRGPARLPAGRSRIMWLPIPLEVAQFQGRETDRHIIGLVT